jgi:hypothetical protein
LKFDAEARTANKLKNNISGTSFVWNRADAQK